MVSAGNLGNETRYECTVMGDTVNEAARLSEVVEVGDGERSWQPVGRTRLRGIKPDTPNHVPSETR
jgi:class 3 adenylate cyclase